jgi:hypothetical protein
MLMPISKKIALTSIGYLVMPKIFGVGQAKGEEG